MSLQKGQAVGNIEYTKVPLKNLLDSMGFYNNKPIETEGHYRCGWEWSDLMLELVGVNQLLQPGHQYFDWSRMIWIDKFSKEMLPCDSMNGRTILVRGILDTAGHGHMGDYVATIRNPIIQRR